MQTPGLIIRITGVSSQRICSGMHCRGWRSKEFEEKDTKEDELDLGRRAQISLTGSVDRKR